MKISEKTYSFLIDNILDVIVEIDLDGIITYISPQVSNVFGYQQNEVIGLKCSKIIHPEDIPKFREALDKVIKTEKIISIELRALHKNKDYISISAKGSLVKVSDTVKIIGVIRDISEQVESENKINELLNVGRVIIKISARFVGMDNIDNVINDSLNDIGLLTRSDHAYLIEFSKDKTIIKKTHQWCAEGIDLLNLNKLFTNYKNNDSNITYWWETQLREAKTIYIKNLSDFPEEDKFIMELLKQNKIKSLLAFPLYIEGNLAGFLGIDNVKELSKWKDSDFTLIVITADIIGNALERKLMEEKVKKSEQKFRDAYEQVNFYKDVFTHDINNIFQNIQSTIELLDLFSNSPEISNKIKKYRHVIEGQIIRGNKLISNVRKLSQIEDSKISLKSINPCNVLNDAIQSTRSGFQNRNIKINVDSYGEDIYVQANDLLLDVFENILINGVIHNKNPEVVIYVRISKEQKERINYVKIEFKDNGVGIHDYQKKYIFQKRTKEHKSGRGMGVGLSLVKKIIDSYSGKIWIEDKIKGDYSKGSNFILLIPSSN